MMTKFLSFLLETRASLDPVQTLWPLIQISAYMTLWPPDVPKDMMIRSHTNMHLFMSTSSCFVKLFWRLEDFRCLCYPFAVMMSSKMSANHVVRMALILSSCTSSNLLFSYKFTVFPLLIRTIHWPISCRNQGDRGWNGQDPEKQGQDSNASVHYLYSNANKVVLCVMLKFSPLFLQKKAFNLLSVSYWKAMTSLTCSMITKLVEFCRTRTV